VRKATTALVGLAGIVTLSASWATGLTPKPAAVTGVHVLSGAKAGTPVAAAPPQPSGSSTSKSSKGSSKSSSGGKVSKAPAAAPQSGTVDGAVVGTQYGSVQVRVSFTGKKITNVHALQLTDSSGTSVSISAGAAPTLRHEALAAQSAKIDVVSGATYTSEAYQQSLQSALDAAHLG
jgi:uncharacterized protein with FMN-binding domain